VLGQQLPNLALREIAQAQRLGLDVEGAAALDVRPFPAGIDLIVAHVADSAQDDTLREMARTAIIVRSQLAEDGDKRVPHERVDLIDQQHQWYVTSSGPAHECLAQGSVGAVFFKVLRHCALDKIILEHLKTRRGWSGTRTRRRGRNWSCMGTYTEW